MAAHVYNFENNIQIGGDRSKHGAARIAWWDKIRGLCSGKEKRWPAIMQGKGMESWEWLPELPSSQSSCSSSVLPCIAGSLLFFFFFLQKSVAERDCAWGYFQVYHIIQLVPIYWRSQCLLGGTGMNPCFGGWQVVVVKGRGQMARCSWPVPAGKGQP